MHIRDYHSSKYNLPQVREEHEEEQQCCKRSVYHRVLYGELDDKLERVSKNSNSDSTYGSTDQSGEEPDLAVGDKADHRKHDTENCGKCHNFSEDFLERAQFCHIPHLQGQ